MESNNNFNIKEFFMSIFMKKKPEPVNTSLMRERMQPATIAKLEGIGRELKSARPRFLGTGHITILGPVACFIPLSVFMTALFGWVALLFMLIPAIFTPLFLYLRAKGTEELYGRSDFDLGLFHYKSCKSYVGHGKYIFEAVLKATVPYVAFALVMMFLFLSWGNSFDTVDTDKTRRVSGEVEYILDKGDYIAIGIEGDELVTGTEGNLEIVEIAEYRLTKFVKYADQSLFALNEGDEITLKVSTYATTGKSSVLDKNVQIYEIAEIFDDSKVYFGEEQIALGEKENTRALVLIFATFIVYAGACAVAVYFADKYFKESTRRETIELPELV